MAFWSSPKFLGAAGQQISPAHVRRPKRGFVPAALTFPSLSFTVTEITYSHRICWHLWKKLFTLLNPVCGTSISAVAVVASHTRSTIEAMQQNSFPYHGGSGTEGWIWLLVGNHVIQIQANLYVTIAFMGGTNKRRRCLLERGGNAVTDNTLMHRRGWRRNEISCPVTTKLLHTIETNSLK